MRRIRRHVELLASFDEALIFCPEARAFREPRSRQEMQVDKADAHSVYLPMMEKSHDFLMGGNADLGQQIQNAQDFGAVRQTSQGDFTDDERVNAGIAAVEMALQDRIGASEMVYPDRRINQDHRPPPFGDEALLGRRDRTLPNWPFDAKPQVRQASLTPFE
jgi:hypothetical protein